MDAEWFEGNWTENWLRVKDGDGIWHVYRKGQPVKNPPLIHLHVQFRGMAQLVMTDRAAVVRRDRLPGTFIVKETRGGTVACYEYVRE